MTIRCAEVGRRGKKAGSKFLYRFAITSDSVGHKVRKAVRIMVSCGLRISRLLFSAPRVTFASAEVKLLL
jgi:hypothetical protein